jgi:hypothetical protein
MPAAAAVSFLSTQRSDPADLPCRMPTEIFADPTWSAGHSHRGQRSHDVDLIASAASGRSILSLSFAAHDCHKKQRRREADVAEMRNGIEAIQTNGNNGHGDLQRFSGRGYHSLGGPTSRSLPVRMLGDSLRIPCTWTFPSCAVAAAGVNEPATWTFDGNLGAFGWVSSESLSWEGLVLIPVRTLAST